MLHSAASSPEVLFRKKSKPTNRRSGSSLCGEGREAESSPLLVHDKKFMGFHSAPVLSVVTSLAFLVVAECFAATHPVTGTSFPRSRVTNSRRGASTLAMSTPSNVVIAGGGIQSAAISYYLSKRGITSTVVER